MTGLIAIIVSSLVAIGELVKVLSGRTRDRADATKTITEAAEVAVRMAHAETEKLAHSLQAERAETLQRISTLEAEVTDLQGRLSRSQRFTLSLLQVLAQHGIDPPDEVLPEPLHHRSTDKESP